MSTIDLARPPVLTRQVEPSDDLLREDRPVMLHLPGLLTAEYSDAAAALLRTLSLKPYAATLGSDEFAPIPKLGPALFEYHDEMHRDRTDGLGQYFDQADADATLLRSLFLGSEIRDPLDVLHDITSALLGQPVTVAKEGSRTYFSGVVRDITGGALPHYDDASVDTPDLAVGQTDRQLSVLLYLTDFLGGGLTSYEKKPTAEDNVERQLAYGYNWEAVQGVSFRGVVPTKGSVVAFNPRYLHSVAPLLGEQRRLTISAFIGRRRTTGELISWS